MSELPITHMTLYKHGVGFFQRRARFGGDKVDLTFRAEEMNDVLKSLTAIDWGAGQVLGVEYATPQSQEERLEGCSIHLREEGSLTDLLSGLRGRRVTLRLDQAETATGLLIGIDRPEGDQPLTTILVSLLAEGDRVQAFPLGRVQGVDILDERGAADLRFFLDTSLNPETHRLVTIRLSPGEHDLMVSYVAPAPTWRVSYRLVLDDKRALLQGWGIFDNRLEEDLNGVSLALVAGMPISFVYDLYTPFTPARPEVKEEGRVASGPVVFEAAASYDMAPPSGMRALREMGAPAMMAAAPIAAGGMAASTMVSTSGKDLGELFQYTIQTPVSVGRGQSAMAPILSSRLEYRKDLLYNANKLPDHPVATLRLRNETGLTLERGPATVLESAGYLGEAVLPFTAVNGEIVAPYAVELGLKVREDAGSRRETHAVSLSKAYLLIEEWEIRWREYRVRSSMSDAATVLIEHLRSAHYELFDTPAPQEQTGDHLRFAVPVEGHKEATLRVQERRLDRRREELYKQSYDSLARYMQRGLLDPKTHEQAAALLRLWEQIEQNRKGLTEANAERERIFKAQQQIQGNMQALSATGKEGDLRSRYVDELQASERRLKELDQSESNLKAAIEKLEREIEKRLAALE
jgi:hypothetical protein